MIKDTLKYVNKHVLKEIIKTVFTIAVIVGFIWYVIIPDYHKEADRNHRCDKLLEK